MRIEQIDALIREHITGGTVDRGRGLVSLEELRNLVRAAAPSMPARHAKIVRRRRDFLTLNGHTSYAAAERNALDWVLDQHDVEELAT